MSATPPRDHVSPPLPPTAAPDRLQHHVEALSTGFSDTSRPVWLQDAVAKIHAAHCIRQVFFEAPNPSQVRDHFRHLSGFQAIITLLRSMSSYEELSGWTDEDTETQLELLQITFSVLAAALQDHWGNSKYFRKRVESGGWTALKDALLRLVVQGSENTKGSDYIIREHGKQRFFGYLLACAVNEDGLVGVFSRLGRHVKDGNSLRGVDTEGDNDKTMAEHSGSNNLSSIARQALRDALGTTISIQNPEMIAVMIEVWLRLEHAKVSSDFVSDVVSLTLPMVISQVIRLSTHSLVTVHGTKVLDIILPCLLDPALNSDHIQEFRTLTIALLQYGITSLDNAHFLYRNARSSALVAEVLHSGLQESHTPPHIHFDLSLHGFASVELPDIGRPFPPVSSSAGYTLSIWLYIVAFDPNTHTTLFGAFDSSQTCFVLVYLEKDTHNLILQTSVTSSRPSVRFKSMSFQHERWYHVCIVHRRPKTVLSSKASLFVDGEFVEQVKSHYPHSPPLPPNTSGGRSSALQASTRNSNAVQAFLGTPQDLATQLGRGVVSSQWRLASAHLFADALSDDLIAVYKQLGPRYSGNYQDCLGSFQTYGASAVLNLRNENLHPGKEEKSDIISAIRSKASSLLPESRIILNISPVVVLDDDDRNNIDETQLLKLLSKPAARKLRSATRGGRNAIAVNGAVPSINEALLQPFGFAVLTGNPIVAVPQSLDDAAWRIGGCAAVGLALLEAANTPEAISRALNILFESIKHSWRNSEAMERENGFGVLANLLAGKLNSRPRMAVYGPGMEDVSRADDPGHEELGMELLVSVLDFVGYVTECPENSVINNPLAYRILLVDLDTWRSAAPKVQKLYYKQFVTFGISSKHHNFNGKRLVRMRVIKKWLDALKGDTFTSETFEYFMTAFRSLISSNLSAETLRSLALYITYAIHTPPQRASELQRPRASTSALRQKPMGSPLRLKVPTSPALIAPARSEGHELPRLQIGLAILDLYAGILCNDENTNSIQKFARTVTNKWLLHLLADDEPTVVLLAAKILARLLVLNGASYVKKFAEKTGGFVIMRHRLKRWWNIPTIWPICFAVMFGQDVANLDFERPFDQYNMVETFAPGGKAKVVCSEILPVITAMLRNGLKAVTKEQEDPDSPLTDKGNDAGQPQRRTNHRPTHLCRRSMSLVTGVALLKSQQPLLQRLEDAAATLQTVTRFLAELHTKSQVFRDFTVSSNYVQELLFVLFPVVVSSDVVSPETELNARDSALTFEGNDVVIRPLSRSSQQGPPIVRTTTVDCPSSPKMSRAHPPLMRGSSFILVTSDETSYKPSSARLHPVMSPNSKTDVAMNVRNSIVQELLEIIIAVFSDQIFARKDFPGLGLFVKVPPGFQEHQAYFDSFLLRNALSHLGNSIQLDQKLLCEPRVLTNLARFATHLGESLYEGWFIGGADPVLDFVGGVLEYLQRPEISNLKSIRLCSQIISAIRTVLLRVVLLRLSEMSDSSRESETVSFLDKLAYWQTVILATGHEQDEFLRLLCYLLYTRLISTHERVRAAAVNFWRILLVQKPEETSDVLNQATTQNHIQLSQGFRKLTELDNDNFLCWVDDRREELDAFFGAMSRTWEDFVAEENRKTEDNARARVSKRRERLKVWVSDNLTNDDILRRHEISSDHWRANIYASEHLKRQRALQDQQDNINFNSSIWTKMKRELHRPCGLYDDFSSPKWRLDQTEGRNRMRLRFLPDHDGHLHDYQPKRKKSQIGSKRSLSLQVRTRASSKAGISSPLSPRSSSGHFARQASPSLDSPITKELFEESLEQDEEFEIVDDPRQDPEDFEDKNRKVMRSLQRGDQVEHVNNVSRIVGLEACEGLLILGKDYLYLLDNFFQRSDGEIVNVWQAPQEERDSYLQMISGREGGTHRSGPTNMDHETRSWRWEDVLSISKRRFLFRDVAIEVFFVDGRSYLLTTNTPQLRDELSQKLITKASNVAGGASLTNGEDSWRLESLRSPEDNPQTFGSRFTSVFSQTTSNPATRKWMRGEISNFHYLMLVNTMAGRTFNDLTQYPVFPWVVADYTSEDLDLSNPRSFRDLTKPMGCQTAERQAEFKVRYQSFAEMGDHDSPPFHYGTHYSSAMIVTSYLIRLQPFVQSYLLLQGGTFDHPDRLFHSIEKAWTSASRDNMTDVRELVPEFYFLPEFLVNMNGYDFGSRQGTGGFIDTVVLPPWAKGDPKIFIAKHREALESEYVSKHLHQWIDLVFGHKQRGDAALEATNVFHHLSYHGAKNLDTINDPVERLATIGIIHNFGQTPHQVFQRPHAQREDKKHKARRLDMAAENLTRLPFPLFEISDRVSTLVCSRKHDRILCSGAFRINIPPYYDRYMEWGFADGSVRFYTSDTKKLIGLFEHLHQGQLSYALFADSRTLISAGTDCTISAWAVISTSKSVDLQPKACLFGHRASITNMAVSRAFSALLSASADGQVILWDLNRLEFVREIAKDKFVECARINDVTGVVMLCHGPYVSLYTLNGEPLVKQNVCMEDEDCLTACAFYEGSGNEWLERDLVFTGHKGGVVNIWNKTIRDGKSVLDHVKRMNHLDPAGFNFHAAITCILPMAQVVYTSDEDGRVYEWDCIQRAT